MMTATSSDEPKSEKLPVIYMPSEVPVGSAEGYQTLWMQLLKEAGEKGRQNIDPPLDALGRKRKDNKVAAKTGELTAANEGGRRIVLFRDSNLDFPELDLKVCVLGPPEDTMGFPALFQRAMCEGTDDPYDADLVVFTGGPDVDPAYYGEKPVPSFYGDDERDYFDIGHYLTCLNEGIPMLGVCRGAQFLAAMQGYKLVQDLDNHNTDHPIFDKKTNNIIEKVSSRHHQAVIPGPGMEVIATAFKSTYKALSPDKTIVKEANKGLVFPADTEAYFIRETCSIGIQGHPEYKGYHAFAKWSLDLLNEYVVLNPDIEFRGDRRRIKEDLILEREIRKEVLGIPDPKPERKILTAVTGEK